MSPVKGGDVLAALFAALSVVFEVEEYLKLRIPALGSQSYQSCLESFFLEGINQRFPIAPVVPGTTRAPLSHGVFQAAGGRQWGRDDLKKGGQYKKISCFGSLKQKKR